MILVGLYSFGLSNATKMNVNYLCDITKRTQKSWHVLFPFYLLLLLTCKTKSEAHARVAMIRKMHPKNQSLSNDPVVAAPLALLWGCLAQNISTIGPLYKVISIAPATVTNVPTTFAMHLTCFMFIFSILFTYIIKETILACFTITIKKKWNFNYLFLFSFFKFRKKNIFCKICFTKFQVRDHWKKKIGFD